MHHWGFWSAFFCRVFPLYASVHLSENAVRDAGLKKREIWGPPIVSLLDRQKQDSLNSNPRTHIELMCLRDTNYRRSKANHEVVLNRRPLSGRAQAVTKIHTELIHGDAENISKRLVQ